MHTALQKYFAQRVKNLFNHLHDFELNGDDVSLHDFRVEIKKLRAILKFLRNIYPKQKLKKASQSLRTIFQTAGEIREYQLLQQWLQKYQFAIIENRYFPDELKQTMIGLFEKNSEEHKGHLKEVIDQVSEFVSSTNEILPEQYFAEQNAQVEKLVRKNLPQSEWHDLRKLIKQRIYAYNWLIHENENDDPVFPYYNKLQELIGQWHDFEIIKDSFSQKQLYLSPDIEVQKEFSQAWDKVNSLIKQKEKQIEEMLAKELVGD